MRLKVLIWAILFLSPFAFANDINISTVTKQGITHFYLQAGVFTIEKEALKRQSQLAQLVSNPIEIKNLSDKRLFLVQIGPIDDYIRARALKEKLSQNTVTPIAPLPPASPTLDPNPAFTETETPQRLPPASKLWNLRNADIRAVISEISRVTGKNFVVDPRVQGKVSLISSKPMSNNALYQVFLSALQVNGYAAIPTGDIIKIVPVIDAKGLAPGLINELKETPRGDDMMVSVVPVHYVPADQLVPVIRPLMPQWSNVSAYSPSNMLILSGRANNVRRLTHLIKQVDSSNANGIDIVHLRHALAMDVVASLKDIIKTQPNMPGKEQLSIGADDKTNSILVSGNKTDRLRLRMLLMKLDKSNSDSTNKTTQVVYLHYLRAEDLVPILAGIAQANFSGIVGTTIGTITRPILDSTNPASNLTYPSSSPSIGSSVAVAAPVAAPPPAGHSDATANTTIVTTQNEGSTKPNIQIIAEPNTNSIILNAPAAIIRTLKSVICQLDIKPAQLLIEAIVAEVNQDQVKDLGIEWGSNPQTGNVNNFQPGFAIINSRTKLRDLQAQIYALATDRKANILSTPSVVVLDNRQAKILIGKQVSVASTSYPNNGGGTTVASPYTTFDRVNVALHLYVRPQITKGQGIQLQIDQGNDTLDPSSLTNTTTPTFSISSIVTSVNVESGDIVVLGGLTQDGLGNNDIDVPILGGIPGIGRLFQRNIRTRQKKVLMVFIKPIILRSERDAVVVSGDKYDDTRDLQLAWVRSQEIYYPHDDETVLPPLLVDELPRPFNHPPLNLVEATK